MRSVTIKIKPAQFDYLTGCINFETKINSNNNNKTLKKKL